MPTARTQALACGLGCLLLLCAPSARAIFGFEPHFRHGAVFARALVMSENGNPIFAEYDTTGQLVSEIGEVTGDLADGTIMSGAEYRSYVALEAEFRAQHQNDIAAGALLISSSAYQGQTFLTVDNVVMSKPSLKPNTRSVLVRGQALRFLPDGDQLVLLEFPVDLTATPSLPDSVMSVLLNSDGTIHTTSEHNIGFKVGYYGEDGDRIFGRGYDDVIHGPVAGAPLEIGFMIGGRGVTGVDGKYSLTYFVPPCPGFTFEYTTPIWVELRYRNFRPTGAATIPYYLRRPDYTFCNGLGAFPPSLTLGGLMTQVAVIGILASQARPNLTADFPVDVMMLTGESLVTNQTIGPYGDVVLGDSTRYAVDAQAPEAGARATFDFDGDGANDTATLGDFVTVDGQVFFEAAQDGALQGIYLSSGDRDPASADPELQVPDFTRVPDFEPNLQPQGLLQSLAVDDLADTDIYVFRKSNGKLVMERQGLSESEVGSFATSQVNEDTGRFVYRLLIRGPVDGLAFVARVHQDFSEWQSAAKMAPELHARAADHLRSGEEVQLIAINRSTGYIGAVTTTLRSANEGGLAEISFPIQEILMGPPNLRITARRAYDIEYGLTSDETVDYIIGYEGAGLTSDNYIQVRTEWFAADGTALPEGLGDFGFTGRLARVDGAGSLDPVGGNLAEFRIKPGVHLQLIQLADEILNKQHFYVHVSGEYEDADFGVSGAAGSGPLQFRPDRYVPLKVQLFDEATTIEQDKVFRRLRRENPDQEFVEPEPVYRDVYRPEFQFSVFDLAVHDLSRVLLDPDGNEQTPMRILEDPAPSLSSGDDLIRVLLSLVGSEFSPLTPIDGDRVLVLSLGEMEQEVVLGTNQTVEFDDVAALALLEPVDFLSVRLYSNSDSANVLWQYAFGLFAVTPDPIPFDGVTRVKIRIGSRSDDIGRITDEAQLPTFRFGGADCEDVRQDEFDENVFYCTPPPAPGDSTGPHDVVVQGLDLPSMAGFSSSGTTTIIEEAVEYVDTAVEGVDMFSEAIGVSIEESNSLAMWEKEQNGLSVEAAALVFMERMDSQVSEGMHLMKTFIEDKEVDDEVGALFDQLTTVNNAKTAEVFDSVGFGTGGGSSNGINIVTLQEPAVKLTQEFAVFLLTKPPFVAREIALDLLIGGTAEDGLDYQLVTDFGEVPQVVEENGITRHRVTIPANEDQLLLFAIPLVDGVTEPLEDIQVTIIPRIGYAVGVFDTAAASIVDGPLITDSIDTTQRFPDYYAGRDAGVISLFPVAFAGPAPPPPPPTPVLGSSSFFSDVDAWMTATGKKLWLGARGHSAYVVMRATDFELSTQTYATVGKTVSDAIADNPDASVIINGALFNYKTKEPLITTGLVYNNRVLQPTSTTSSNDSDKVAKLRYWFGQDRTTPNGMTGASYMFGGKGHPPAIDAAIGGLVSSIWPVGGARTKVTAKTDSDLNVYTGFRGPLYGHGMIGVDRDTGMIIVLSKTNIKWQSFFSNQDLLFDSGVDQAIGTDGGSSVALYADGRTRIRGGRHGTSTSEAETVTSYFLFTEPPPPPPPPPGP